MGFSVVTIDLEHTHAHADLDRYSLFLPRSGHSTLRVVSDRSTSDGFARV